MKGSRKKYRRPGTVLALCLAGLVLTGALAGCGDSPAGGNTSRETVATVAGVETDSLSDSLSDTLPDDRAFTPVDAYAARLTDAFAAATPVPEEDVTYTTDGGGAVLTGYTGGETVVVIPDTLGGLPVTAVAEGAFRDMSSLRALSLPATVRSVGFGALQGCRSLATLRTPIMTCGEAGDWFGALFGAASYEINASEVPSSLTTLLITGGDTVPKGCFYGCTSLEAVGLPEGVKSLEPFAFYGCDSLAYVTLPDGLVSVGQYAFAYCPSLLNLSVPASVEAMGISMLEGCGALETLTLPFVGESREAADHRYLGYLFGAADHTFTEGYIPASLIRLTLLPGCGDIPANAFYSCSRLREVILPEGVTAIGHRAFYRCAYLAAIALPDSLRAIGDEAFKGCARLTDVDLSMVTDGQRLGVQCFMNCTSLASVTLSDSLSALPDGMFSGCTVLSEVRGNDSLPRSGNAFYGCDRLAGQEESGT